MKKLALIQRKLKVPKNEFNSFGNFSYRTTSSILEALKPLLEENNCTLTLSDEIVLLGSRFYIKSSATLTDADDGKSVSSTSFAREAENKKGMDESQITGSASSYARKCALGGLFAIDDCVDADAHPARVSTANTQHEDKKKDNRNFQKSKEVQTNMSNDVPPKLQQLWKSFDELVKTKKDSITGDIQQECKKLYYRYSKGLSIQQEELQGVIDAISISF